MVSCTFFRQFISLDARFLEEKKRVMRRPQLRIQLTSLACIKFFTKANILSISKRLGPVFLRWSIIDILTLFFSIIVAKRHQYVRNNLIKLKIIWKIFIYKKKKRDALPKGDACADQKLSIFFVWPK